MAKTLTTRTHFSLVLNEQIENLCHIYRIISVLVAASTFENSLLIQRVR